MWTNKTSLGALKKNNLLLYHKYLCSLKKKDIILGEGESTEVWTKGLLCARQAVHPWTKHPHYQKYLKMWGNYFNSNRSNYIQYIYNYIQYIYIVSKCLEIFTNCSPGRIWSKICMLMEMTQKRLNFKHYY